ncbi:35184_t:CDS:2, partial [Racocetra persica]
KWPYKDSEEYKATPETLAKAGFYFNPVPNSKDNVVCFLCHKSMEGWDPQDDPFEEHAKHSPDCAWAICYCSLRNFNDEQLPFNWDDKDKLPTSKKLEEARIKTFGTWWPHEGKKGWVGTIKKMAKAGFIYSPTLGSLDNVNCQYCGVGLEGWEPKDDPTKQIKSEVTEVVKIKEEEIELSDMINQLRLNEPTPENSKNNDADQECAMNLTDNQNNISDHMCDNQIETAEVVTNKEYNEEIANPCTGTPPPSFRPAITDKINSVTDKTYSNDQNILSVEEIVEIEADKEYNEEIVIPSTVTPLPSFRPAITDEINSITDNICNNDQVHITDQFEKTEKPNSLTNDSNQMEITERFGKAEVYDNNQMEITERSGKTEKLNSLTNNAYDNQLEITNIREDIECNKETDIPFTTMLNSAPIEPAINRSTEDIPSESLTVNEQSAKTLIIEEVEADKKYNEGKKYYEDKKYNEDKEYSEDKEYNEDKKYNENKEYNEEIAIPYTSTPPFSFHPAITGEINNITDNTYSNGQMYITERFEKMELNSLTDNVYDNNRMEITNIREDMECNKETNIPFTSTPNSLAPIELMNNENIDDTTSEYLTANEQTAKILTVEANKEYNREIAIPYTGTPPLSSRPTITDKTNHITDNIHSNDHIGTPPFFRPTIMDKTNHITDNIYSNDHISTPPFFRPTIMDKTNSITDNIYCNDHIGTPPLSFRPTITDKTNSITTDNTYSNDQIYITERFEKTLSVDDCLRNLTEELNSLTNNAYDNNQMEITSIREDKERNKEIVNPFISTHNSLSPIEPMNNETTEDITLTVSEQLTKTLTVEDYLKDLTEQQERILAEKTTQLMDAILEIKRRAKNAIMAIPVK